MKITQDIWNILHDGEVFNISGETPGCIRIVVKIEYLRKMFDEHGDSIVVTLHDCASLHFYIWDEGRSSKSWDEITSLGAEILSTESNNSPWKIVTTLGELYLEYGYCTLVLDSGKEISYHDLYIACDQYWEAWSKKNKSLKSAQQGDAPEPASPAR